MRQGPCNLRKTHKNHLARPFGLSRRDRREYNLARPLPDRQPEIHRASTRNATHILLTHGHDDHIGDTLRIAEETDAEIVANFDLCMWLESQGAKKMALRGF